MLLNILLILLALFCVFYCYVKLIFGAIDSIESFTSDLSNIELGRDE